ncbi:MAG: diaminopimelate decarboxylase [Micrococcales bacterium]
MAETELQPAWLTEPKDNNLLTERIWPQGSTRDADGEVVFAGVPSSDLTAQFGTPLYVVDKEEFERNAAAVKRALTSEAKRIGTDATVYYAGKAFLCTEVVRWVDELGLNIDVASGGELAIALAAGIDPKRIGLHGNNKSAAEIGRAVSAGVGAIVIDSEIEIERIAATAGAQGKIQPVRIRVNTGVHADTHEFLATAREDQKFGIAMDDVPGLVDKIRKHNHLSFLGLHSHIGSQIFETAGFAEAARRLIRLHTELLKSGPVPQLNLGGGFGINYNEGDHAPGVEVMAHAITEAIAVACQSEGVPVPALAFEPGRAIVGRAGVTLYTVGTIKDVNLGDGQVRKYVSVDGGMSDNARTALYQAEYSTRLVSRVSSAKPALVRVVGKHCESGDIVVRHDYLPSDIAIGDTIAVAATGAYCFSLGSNYNFLPRPPVVAVADGKARLIVRGETEADMLARDVGIKKD